MPNQIVHFACPTAAKVPNQMVRFACPTAAKVPNQMVRFACPGAPKVPNQMVRERITPWGYHHLMVGYSANKDEIGKRLRRIEGQVRGLQRMVEDDRYCIDVLDQISAATRALQAVALGLLDDHLEHCVADALASGGDEAHEKVREASQAIARIVRS